MSEPLPPCEHRTETESQDRFHCNCSRIISPDNYVRRNTCLVCDVYYRCDSRSKSRGLGDLIARATAALGIKPCGGCRKRQAKLNKLFPFGK